MLAMPIPRMHARKGQSAQIVYLRPKKKQRYKTAKSYEQLRQRELSWMLYITEGFLANLAHALAVNCVTFKPKDEAVISNIIAQVDRQAYRLREMMQDLSEKE